MKMRIEYRDYEITINSTGGRVYVHASGVGQGGGVLVTTLKEEDLITASEASVQIRMAVERAKKLIDDWQRARAQRDVAAAHADAVVRAFVAEEGIEVVKEEEEQWV